MALFQKRPEAIIRAYVTEKTRKAFGPLLKYCATRKLAYHIVTEAELEKVTGTDHHEGVCILAKSGNYLDFKQFIRTNHSKSSFWLWLVGVENPHNVGAILRTAAHFGVSGIIVSPVGPALGTEAHAKRTQWTLSASAFRIAEGGAEYVPVMVATGTVGQTAKDIKEVAGLALFAATGQLDATDLWQSRIQRPAVVALGAEGPGLPDAVLKVADGKLRIPGTGTVESLNVSVAAGIISAAMMRHSK